MMNNFIFLNHCSETSKKTTCGRVKQVLRGRSVRRFAENEVKRAFEYLPAIACKAPPRTPPVKRPEMAPTAGARESSVLDFVVSG